MKRIIKIFILISMIRITFFNVKVSADTSIPEHFFTSGIQLFELKPSEHDNTVGVVSPKLDTTDRKWLYVARISVIHNYTDGKQNRFNTYPFNSFGFAGTNLTASTSLYEPLLRWTVGLDGTALKNLGYEFVDGGQTSQFIDLDFNKPTEKMTWIRNIIIKEIGSPSADSYRVFTNVDTLYHPLKFKRDEDGVLVADTELDPNDFTEYEKELNNKIGTGAFDEAPTEPTEPPDLSDIGNGIGDINDNITNPDISGSGSEDFFNNFENEDFGLTSIITAPLVLINSLNNSNCNNLILPLPFVNKNLDLPCMTPIYQQHFSPLLFLYQSITTGFISYYVAIRLFALVKKMKDPDNDDIEVMNL